MKTGPRLNGGDVRGWGVTESPSVWSQREAPELRAGSCGSDVLLGVQDDDEPCRALRKASCRREQETQLGNRVGRSNVTAAGLWAAFSYLAQILGSDARAKLLLLLQLCPFAPSALQAGPGRGLSPGPSVIHLWPRSLGRPGMRPRPQQKASGWHSSPQTGNKMRRRSHLRAARPRPLPAPTSRSPVPGECRSRKTQGS